MVGIARDLIRNIGNNWREIGRSEKKREKKD